MQRMYRALAGALVILFLASVARFYHPGTGFTAFIEFPAGHEHVAPAMRDTPHFHYEGGAYDGQFYAQRALDPLVRDPAFDQAMDLAPYRARRILFSWTAFAAGLGRPAWILEAYSLQNVVCWLLLAALLTRWMPLTSPRGLALWAACLFSHGLLTSVRLALLDGPSLVLIALAVVAAENGRPLLSALVTGVAGLGRETSVLGAAAQPVPRRRRDWLRLALAMILVVLPLIVWLDYLRSIYRSTIRSGTNQLVLPGTALADVWSELLFRDLPMSGLFSMKGLHLCLVGSLAAQCVYLLVRRAYAVPWWRVAAAYAVLMLMMERSLVHPDTGAFTRVLLPLTVGFNALLATEARATRFWPWFVLGNAHVLAAGTAMPLVPWR
jgi:hypothetical protein